MMAIEPRKVFRGWSRYNGLQLFDADDIGQKGVGNQKDRPKNRMWLRSLFSGFFSRSRGFLIKAFAAAGSRPQSSILSCGRAFP